MNTVVAASSSDAASPPLERLGIVGNGQIIALVGAEGDIAWCCWPRPDDDPVFCELLGRGTSCGRFSISVVGQTSSEFHYRRNTAIAEACVRDDRGNALRVTTWAPKFIRHGREHRPPMLIRKIEPISGRPVVRVTLRPASHFGEHPHAMQLGMHHVSFSDGGRSVRVTTDASVSYLAEDRAFIVDRCMHFVLAEDGPLTAPIHQLGADMFEATERYWTTWVRRLAIPYEWQAEVIRAAITLQLCCFEDTGGMISAPTTSIPAAPDGSQNWDYRYCWLRQAPHLVHALSLLGAVDTAESQIRFLEDLLVREGASRLQSVYGLSGERDLQERDLARDATWGPIRVGNQAHCQSQHDVYGSVILACSRAFHDERFERTGDASLFERLEALGERAVPLFDRRDAGPFESRAKPRRYTHSAAMCWAACDRLSRIAQRLSLTDRAGFWKKRADFLRVQILSHIWRESRGCFSAVMDEDEIDASLLLLPELGLVSCRDPRWLATLEVIGRELRSGDFLMRARPGSGEEPEQLYTLSSLWWARAQAAVGRYDEARETFEKVLRGRNGLGLLSERFDARTGRLWGNFPHTAAMAAIITTAARLSCDWDAAA